MNKQKSYKDINASIYKEKLWNHMITYNTVNTRVTQTTSNATKSFMI